MTTEQLPTCPICRHDRFLRIHESYTVVRCASCGFFFQNPRPTQESIKKYYSRSTQYDGWLNNEEGRKRMWQRRLKIFLSYTANKQSIIDVGAGIGAFLSLAKPWFPAVATGTEISESAIKIAFEKFGIDLIQGQLEDIDFKEKKFDCVSAYHVLEHVPDPVGFIKKCHNLLNDNGVLILAVPNEIKSWIRRPLKRLLSILKIGKYRYYGIYGIPVFDLTKEYVPEIHLSHFDNQTLRLLLEKNGFSICLETLDPYFSDMGVIGAVQYCLWKLFGFVYKVTGINRYDTIAVVARKV